VRIYFSELTWVLQKSAPSVRYFIAIIFIAAAAATIVVNHLINGISIFDTYAEFVAYRVSDALSIYFGESDGVRPVQGIPTALISKYVTLVLFWLFDKELLTRPVLQIYGLAVYGVLFLILATSILMVCRRLRWIQFAGLAAVALYPWYVSGPSISLLAAPEYWLGEYVFLVSVFCYACW